ncbi:ABC transporter ATP-binding protein [Pantanalinema sp. GBBB05]|uniref:ABC transporter ATP-binding protein n=1 Tax=Pantanalinema sp. GBBB05 TaxID=2604139 RepID=UPI001DC1B166|nr:ABC transporter ATP-binding protein [Pantanalinema sp. GBBB05]
MDDTAIRVDNLGKKYLLSHQQEGRKYKSLRDMMADNVKSLGKRIFGAEKAKNTNQEEFWALKNVSFDIQHGDRVGIIGRNGAGKSTLLKLLSRITEPTKGRINIQGRVASLLEVGTGFHPELTGRENIYLNGAILGMSREEIKRKFDAIVAFAEVEKFLDTPVKRYSSGMYVRLAFSVAAHLEPEILIVDEVLAVGDAQFQKKCLGKMEEVGREGRTVLFVSHNMQAISQLTNRCVLLHKGEIQFNGLTEQAVKLYLHSDRKNSEQISCYRSSSKKRGNYLAWATVHTSEPNGFHKWGHPIIFEFALNINNSQESICFAFQIVNSRQENICHFQICDAEKQYGRRVGVYILRCSIPKFRLYMGTYTLTTWLAEKRSNSLVESLNNICQFQIDMIGIHRPEYDWRPNDCTYIEDASWMDIKIMDSQKTLVN